MGKKTVRLRFTEDDLADDAVRKAAQKAEKAAEKADRAKDKLPTKRLKQTEPESCALGRRKLRRILRKAHASEGNAAPMQARRSSLPPRPSQGQKNRLPLPPLPVQRLL